MRSPSQGPGGGIGGGPTTSVPATPPGPAGGQLARLRWRSLIRSGLEGIVDASDGGRFKGRSRVEECFSAPGERRAPYGRAGGKGERESGWSAPESCGVHTVCTYISHPRY